MSLHPQPFDPVPEQTAKVARAAFPKGNLCIKMRDEFGIFSAMTLSFLPRFSLSEVKVPFHPGAWHWLVSFNL